MVFLRHRSTKECRRSGLPPTAESLVQLSERESCAHFTACQESLSAQAGTLSSEHREEVGGAELLAQLRQAKGFPAGLGWRAQEITAGLLLNSIPVRLQFLTAFAM
jgi:hypothetical protein